MKAGYYNGLTFHRVVPNFVIQGGSPGANEYAGDGLYMRDEIGTASHVRGTVGFSTRGRDTGDAQFFINLVDNPRLDFEYTVFGVGRSGDWTSSMRSSKGTPSPASRSRRTTIDEPQAMPGSAQAEWSHPTPAVDCRNGR